MGTTTMGERRGEKWERQRRRQSFPCRLSHLGQEAGRFLPPLTYMACRPGGASTLYLFFSASPKVKILPAPRNERREAWKG